MTLWFDEDDADDMIIRFAATRIIAQERTAFQDLVIFESPRFGRSLGLDGIIQTTEADEAYYHEMIVHVPLLAHGSVKRVLVIGGGDGGTLRELFKHPVEAVTLVELDEGVVDACREHMPALPAGAFEDPRLDLKIADGVAYVADCEETFDAILVDSTDPLPGPSEVLFTESFYADCKRILATGGVLISQYGIPFLFPEPVRKAAANLKSSFADVALYQVAVPTFAGGAMAFGWAADGTALRQVPEAILQTRFDELGLQTKIYSPAFHKAAFVLPKDLQRLV